jgi:hypothetical protein
MTDNFFDADFSFAEDDVWQTVREALSSNETVFQRDYLVSIYNTVRRVDIVVYHQSFGLLVIEVRDFYIDEILQISPNMWTVQDREFENSATYEIESPALQASNLLNAVVRLFELNDIPLQRTTSFVFLPYISEELDLEIDIVDPSAIGIALLSSDKDGSGNRHRKFLFQEHLQPFEFLEELSRLGDTKEDLTSVRPVEVIDREILDRVRGLLNRESPLRNQSDIDDTMLLRDLADKLSDTYAHKNKTVLFMSYRKADSRWATGRVYEYLRHTFNGNIFFDFDSIKPGFKWQEAIRRALDECAVMLVVIGPEWETISNGPMLRIFEPNDWVAREVRTALSRKVPIIPIYIDRPQPPNPVKLPLRLRSLAQFQGLFLESEDFFPKMNVLTDSINQLLGIAVR